MLAIIENVLLLWSEQASWTVCITKNILLFLLFQKIDDFINENY